MQKFLLFLPDKDTVKGDLLDYGTEIEWYDSQLSRILDTLKEEGRIREYHDYCHGRQWNAFPRSKSNLF